MGTLPLNLITPLLALTLLFGHSSLNTGDEKTVWTAPDEGHVTFSRASQFYSHNSERLRSQNPIVKNGTNLGYNDHIYFCEGL